MRDEHCFKSWKSKGIFKTAFNYRNIINHFVFLLLLSLSTYIVIIKLTNRKHHFFLQIVCVYAFAFLLLIIKYNQLELLKFSFFLWNFFSSLPSSSCMPLFLLLLNAHLKTYAFRKTNINKNRKCILLKCSYM